MKIKFLFCILFSWLSFHSSFAADSYQVGDELYVWAKSGLNIRSTPDIKARKIGKFSHGDLVEIMAISDQTYQMKGLAKNGDGKGPYLLTGKWVKVANKEYEGYVIDTYLLKYTPPKQDASFLEFMQNLTEAPIKLDTATNLANCAEENCYSVNGKNSSGFKFQASLQDGNYTEAIFIPNMTIEEGFVLSEYLSFLDTEIGNFLKLPEMEISHLLADRLIMQDNDTVKIRYINQEGGLRISVSLWEQTYSYQRSLEEWLYEVDYTSDKAEDFLKIEYISADQYYASKEIKSKIESKLRMDLFSKKDSTLTIKLGNDSLVYTL